MRLRAGTVPVRSSLQREMSFSNPVLARPPVHAARPSAAAQMRAFVDGVSLPEPQDQLLMEVHAEMGVSHAQPRHAGSGGFSAGPAAPAAAAAMGDGGSKGAIGGIIAAMDEPVLQALASEQLIFGVSTLELYAHAHSMSVVFFGGVSDSRFLCDRHARH
jgi:hypothetical protein